MLDSTTLLAPQGPLTPTLFPGDDVNALKARADAYVTSAYVDSRVVDIVDATTKDKAAKALALYSAFMAVYIRMTAEPINVNIAEKGTTTYSTAQLANIKAIADGYLAELESLVEPDGTAVDAGTLSISNRFVW